MSDTEEFYFAKEWDEEKVELSFNDKTYYALAYPLDQEESDTIVIRVYANSDYKTGEYGNGLWTDTGANVIEGNDELDFQDLSTSESVELEYQLVRKLFKQLKEKGVI